MKLSPLGFSLSHNLLVRLTAVWTALGTIFYVLAPLTAPALLVLSAVAPLMWCLLVHGRLPRLEVFPVSLVLGLASIYLSINASWSPSPAWAYLAAGCLLLFSAALHASFALLQATATAGLRAMALGFVIGLGIASAILCIEAFSNQWTHRLLMNEVQWFRPAPRHMSVMDDTVVYLPPYLLNRCAAVITILFWPAVFLAHRLGMRRAWVLLIAVLAAAAILRAKHGTSKVAFVGSGLIFMLAVYARHLARNLLIAFWIVSTLLVVPLSLLAYSQQLQNWDWLAHSARHRIVIWGHTSGLVSEAPILGVGIGSARALNEATDLDDLRRKSGKAKAGGFTPSTSAHAHNGYLQAWYEAGAIGAIFLLSIGLLVLRGAARASPSVQPSLFATFSACALVGASSFNLWQPWFMASFGLAGLFAVLARALADRDAPTAGH
jgi:O-antigen ligase